MKRDCERCQYHYDERGMGGGSFIVCDHPDSTCSWPDICPLDHRRFEKGPELHRPEEHMVLDAINNTIKNK